MKGPSVGSTGIIILAFLVFVLQPLTAGSPMPASPQGGGASSPAGSISSFAALKDASLDAEASKLYRNPGIQLTWSTLVSYCYHLLKKELMIKPTARIEEYGATFHVLHLEKKEDVELCYLIFKLSTRGENPLHRQYEYFDTPIPSFAPCLWIKRDDLGKLPSSKQLKAKADNLLKVLQREWTYDQAGEQLIIQLPSQEHAQLLTNIVRRVCPDATCTWHTSGKTVQLKIAITEDAEKELLVPIFFTPRETC